MKKRLYWVVAGLVALGALAIGVRSPAPAGATVPSAVELADHALNALGPDDEGSYRLIDPIGPGGVASVDAANEVYATTLQGGKYQPWQAYRDPFAPTGGPPSPYPGSASKPYGGGGR